MQNNQVRHKLLKQLVLTSYTGLLLQSILLFLTMSPIKKRKSERTICLSFFRFLIFLSFLEVEKIRQRRVARVAPLLDSETSV